jgi:hypothetical protein
MPEGRGIHKGVVMKKRLPAPESNKEKKEGLESS